MDWADQSAIGPLRPKLLSRYLPDGFAYVSVDESECVAVMDTLWFRQSIHQPDWERAVMDTLRDLNVTTVYLPHGAYGLKRLVDDKMNAMMDAAPFELRYPCNQCKRTTCAVTKAYLQWRKVKKKEVCNLPHEEEV